MELFADRQKLIREKVWMEQGRMEQRSRQVQLITQRLRVIFKAVQAHSKYVEKTCGLSSAKLWMLHEIAANPGLKVSRLAASLSIHPSTCSNMLGRLEEKSLVYRDRSKTDQRTVHLYITELGQELLAKAPKPAQGRLSSAFEKMSDPQLETLEQSLDELVRVLQLQDCDAGFVPIVE